MNILITGPPGIGKTTLIKKLSFKIKNAGGFYTEEIRRNHKRWGFRIVSLDGPNTLFSSIDIESPYRVGKYKIDLTAFEKVAVDSIERAINKDKIIIIDEIGPMELFSERFKSLVVKALDLPNSVIATIKLQGGSFINKIKARKEVVLYDINSNNKDVIFKRIIDRISKEII